MKDKAWRLPHFDGGYIDRVERDIAPQLKAAITIPEDSDPFAGVAIYVAQAVFVEGPPPDKALQRIAYLVAAAPDLYEALDIAMRLLREVWSGNPNHPIWAMGPAALAKARGESEPL
jgi:hypothetical protein